MNAAARALTQGTFTNANIRLAVLSGQMLAVIGLAFALIVSAFSIVYMKDNNRQLFSEWQSLQQEKNQLQINYGQLILEQGAWSTQLRIQHIAEEKLNMIFPQHSDIIVINSSH